jgi:hypothetical protein
VANLQEVESLRQQLSNYDKDKMTLQLTKQRLLHADKQLKNLEWEKEVLSQRFTKVEAERNELFKKFESSIQEVQQKTGLKKMLLEKKVEALNEALERKQTQLAEILTASNLDASSLQHVRPCSALLLCSFKGMRESGDSIRNHHWSNSCLPGLGCPARQLPFMAWRRGWREKQLFNCSLSSILSTWLSTILENCFTDHVQSFRVYAGAQEAG